MDGVEVVGTFKPEAFFQALALILSRKHGANITVKVTRPDDGAGRVGEEGGTDGTGENGTMQTLHLADRF